jgi:hypothetical protein
MGRKAMSRAKPVFLSYARRTAGSAARAVHEELGKEICFIDTEDIEVADRFPQRLSEALLSARLVVAFVDRVYFKRWHCLREWMLTLAPWRSAIESGRGNPDSALAHLVIVFASDLAEEDLARLPPQAQRTNWLTAADPRKIAEHVRRRLRKTRATVRRQFQTFRVPPSSRDLLTSDAVLPLQPRPDTRRAEHVSFRACSRMSVDRLAEIKTRSRYALTAIRCSACGQSR